MKIKLLTGLLVLALLGVVIAGVFFLVQGASSELVKGGPPDVLPGWCKLLPDPLACFGPADDPALEIAKFPSATNPACLRVQNPEYTLNCIID